MKHVARVVAVVVVAAAASVGAISACSSFSASSDGPDGGAAADAANLLTNGDFELGCAGWGGNNAVLTANTDGTLVHGGGGSCLVCATGDAGARSELFASVHVAAPQKAQFHGGAWLRNAPARSAPALTVHLDLTDRNGAGLEQGPFNPAGPLAETWKKVDVLLDVTTSDGGGINIYITGMESGRCYLIDDAWVSQLKRQPA